MVIDEQSDTPMGGNEDLPFQQSDESFEEHPPRLISFFMKTTPTSCGGARGSRVEVEGRGSRVEGRGSRVEGRGSRASRSDSRRVVAARLTAKA
jgi:hypothetical protein